MFVIMKVICIDIDYDEMDPLHSYRGVVISDSNNREIKRFYSGDAAIDFNRAVDSNKTATISYCSSVTYFVMDNEYYHLDSNAVMHSNIDFQAQKSVEHR